MSATNTSGLLGLTRVATMLPSSAPTPTAPSTVPQGPAPPRSRSATTGPSAVQAAHITFATAKKTMHAKTHRRDRTAIQPSRRSLRNALRFRSVIFATCRAAKHAALIAKVAASAAIA